MSENLIESTNELLGIKDHVGAAIYNINPDFEKRSISYALSYDFCGDAANMYAYANLAIDVEINRDYIVVSHVEHLSTLESTEISSQAHWEREMELNGKCTTRAANKDIRRVYYSAKKRDG